MKLRLMPLALALMALVLIRVDVTHATITEFSSGLTPGSKPMGLLAGPDGNLWFTHYGTEEAGPAVARITPDGVITEFRDGLGGSPQSIVAGPDGNLWFGINGNKTSPPAIGRITPTGVITRYAELTKNTSPDELTLGPDGRIWWVSNGGTRPGLGYVEPGGVIFQAHLPTWPSDIAAGPEGNMWFTYGEGATAAVARIVAPDDPGATNITYFSDGLREESDPRDIVLGPDGNLWFSDPWINAIGKVTPDGNITEFDAPNLFRSFLVPGPDGYVWFADWGLNRISPSGEIRSLGTPGNEESRNPEDLVFGSGGELWFTASRFEDPGNGAIGRITPLGAVEEYNVGMNPGAWPTEIALGADGNLWFADWGQPSAVGRATPDGNSYRPSWGADRESGPPPGASPLQPSFPPVPRVVPTKRRIVVNRSGLARVKLTCVGAITCTGLLKIHVRKPVWKVERTLGEAPFSIAPGTSARLTVQIDKAGRMLLRQTGRRSARLTVSGVLMPAGYPVKLIRVRPGQA